MSAVPFAPDEVLSMAQYYGINLDDRKEYWLLDIAKQSIIAPLLATWHEEADACGDPVFVNNRTGLKTQRHPLDEGFLQLAKDARSEGPPPGNESRSVMAFPRAEGGESFYDFATRETLTAAVGSDRLILEFDHTRLPKYSKEDIEFAVARGTASTSPRDEYHHARLQQEPSVRVLSLDPRIEEAEGGSYHLSRPHAHNHPGFAPSADAPKAPRRRKPARRGPLQHLTFFSRWFEDYESADISGRFNGEYAGGGLKPRHATLKMSLETNAFDITIQSGGADEPDVTLQDLQSVTTTAGMPVQPWDMHVGAVLETLGNYVVCVAATRRPWLTDLAGEVLKLRTDLLIEFRKYNQEPFSPAMLMVRGQGGGRNARSYCDGVELQKQASVSVQGAADQVMRLADLLEPYRPSIAAKYRARLRDLRGDQKRLPSSGSVQSPNAMLRSRSVRPMSESFGINCL